MKILGNGDVMLRSFCKRDRTILAKLVNNRKIWDNLRDIIPFPYTEEDASAFIRSCKNENLQQTFAIVYQDEFAGCIGLVIQKDIYRLSAEIGYWIGEPYWGNGIALKAVNLITEYGFNELKLVRIYSGVFDFNKASQRVMEKAGYKLEAIFERSVIKNGIICDEYRYAKINSSF
jgi:[ribosomal protein S5]-alanine N-acetyltransferase